MSAWPRVGLAALLRRSRETIDPRPDTEYREITVRLWGKGVVERSLVTGLALSGRRFVAHEGQFIASRIDARNGAMGLVPATLDGALVTNDFPLFELNRERLHPPYLGWLCRTASFVELCRRASEGTTNRVRLKEEEFLALEILLPPLPEQQRVVVRIEEITTKIAEARVLRDRTIEEADVLWWNSLAQPYAGAASLGIPLSRACSQIVDNLHTTPRYDGDTFPCVRSQDIGWGTMNLATALRTSSDEFAERTRREEPRIGDIVFVREGDVGRCAAVAEPARFSLGQRVMMFRPSATVLPKFLALQLMSRPVLEEQILTGKTGTTSHHVNIKHLRDVRVLVPSLPEQHRIVADLDALQAEVDALRTAQAASRAKLNAMLPAVLGRAFAGAL